jgi:L-glyceraldehyde 3-phosphate reductase
MEALEQAVKSGKALYVGLSNYNPSQTKQAIDILKSKGVRCLIHQPKYSMFHREPEEGLLDVLQQEGIGCIPFSPLAQGLLTDRYLQGIPQDSRAGKRTGFLQEGEVTEDKITKVVKLAEIAKGRGQSIAQLALTWVMRSEVITTVLIGASSVKQLQDNIDFLSHKTLSYDEIQAIEAILQ